MRDEHSQELNRKAKWVKLCPVEAAELILEQQKDIDFYKSALAMREAQLKKLGG